MGRLASRPHFSLLWERSAAYSGLYDFHSFPGRVSGLCTELTAPLLHRVIPKSHFYFVARRTARPKTVRHSRIPPATANVPEVCFKAAVVNQQRHELRNTEIPACSYVREASRAW